MRWLGIISIMILVITLLIIAALYFNNKEAEGILDLSIISMSLTFIYKLAKGGK